MEGLETARALGPLPGLCAGLTGINPWCIVLYSSSGCRTIWVIGIGTDVFGQRIGQRSCLKLEVARD
jgi:hypothetical protein